MNTHKIKPLAGLLALCLALLLSLSACAEFKPAVNTPGGSADNTETSDGTETGGEDETIPEGAFTVTLSYNGAPYVPSGDTPIYAQWTDGFSVHKAPIDGKGQAVIEGLDGDYRVTLSAIPAGYAYDPTAYIATNDRSSVVIELYRLVETTRGGGTDLYNDPIHINETGVYAATLDLSKGVPEELFFRFSPTKSGTYSVESWVDTMANEVNPIAHDYGANVFFMQVPPTVYDGGGEEASYTKNFKFDVKIADEQISSGGGQVAFTFGITGTSKSELYPVTVYFVVKLDGEFSIHHVKAPIIVPQELEDWSFDLEGTTYVYAETEKTVGDVTGYVFDGDRYKYWSRDEGGDGFYHVYDMAAYPTTNGYGPILFADIGTTTRFLGPPDQRVAFTQVEAAGNKALTVNGTENYKLFIEGYNALATDPNPHDNPGDSEPYFCTSICPCRLNGTNESWEIAGVVGSCTEACQNCHPDCRRCPAEAMGAKGYGNYGRAPVTKELQEFLQKFSISQRLFMDGDGWVEDSGIFASEDDQWLFACGYYEKMAENPEA